MKTNELDTPFWKQKTFWAFALSFALAAPSLVEQLAPFLTDEQRLRLAAAAAIVAGIGNLFARMGGVTAAKKAAASKS